eukprot:sb/3471146/
MAELITLAVHHEFFYEMLRRRSATWNRHQSIGDILLQLFQKPALFAAYSAYIDNYSLALEIVEDARHARPAFSKLLDKLLSLQKLRNKSNQMSLEELIRLPVEHIPQVDILTEKLAGRQAQAEKNFSVRQLERKITGLKKSLIAPQRFIVRSDRVRELVRKLSRLTLCSCDEQFNIICQKPMSRYKYVP